MYAWYLPNSDERIIRQMLSEIGLNSIDELFSDVKDDLKLKRELRLPNPLSEQEVRNLVEGKLNRNRVHGKDLISFVGGGVYVVEVPSVVTHIITRGEFLTAYTPYQPEVSQGVLQSLFEYQSLICELTGMDVANASMYDYGTAAAEALLMSARVTRRRKVLIAGNSSPLRREVMKTYTGPHLDLLQVTIDKESGTIDLNDLKSKLDENVASVYVESPSFIGSIESRLGEISELVHNNGSLLIVGVDPISLAIIKPPSEFGADIVVGEGQVLGNNLNFGGPLLGIFAVRGDMRLIRQMPGRIVGMSRTFRGERAFVNILQTREQHIRREKATSNICTNEALTAIAAAVYLSLLGKEGLRSLAESLLYKAHYLSKRLRNSGVNAPPYSASLFREVLIPIRGRKAKEVIDEGLKRGLIPGIDVTDYFPEYGEALLSAVYESHGKREIDALVELIVDSSAARR